jgi:hypothetical protein
MQGLKVFHAGVAWVLVAAILYQVFLAGSAIANLGGSGDFSAHAGFGFTVVGLAALAVLLTAVISRASRRDIGISFGLLLLYVVQVSLPGLKSAGSWIAALHPVNAMFLFALAVWYARHAWQVRNSVASPAPAATASPAVETR